jgi:hypothetical protein
MPVNPYAAPSSDVNAEAAGDAGSLEAALAGNYDFTIEEVLKDAWRLNNGFKLTFWGAALVIGGAAIVFTLIVAYVSAKMGIAGQLIKQLIQSAVGGVTSLAIYTLAIRRAGGLPTSFGDAFSRLDQWLPALIAGVLINLFFAIGLVLLVAPGIYLFVAYHMALPLIADRKMGTWDAMETSRKALSKKWLKMFLTGLVTIALTGLSALLIIPLIWTLPWSVLVTSVAYRRIFGVATTA